MNQLATHRLSSEAIPSTTGTPFRMNPDHSSAGQRTIDARALHALVGSGEELAILDVRGQGEFSEKNMFHATTMPLGQLEVILANALPRRDVRVVLVSGAKDGLSERAARRLTELGYGNVAVLEGGIGAWESAGLPVYSGTHVRSKAFSEVLEEALHVPWIDAPMLARFQASGRAVAIFDSRSFPEYQRITVPGATSLPGAELVRHIRDQAPDPATLVVVTCGGRTRSIIGAQALINAGVPNEVVSLKDGTMGLRRDALPMETGAARRPMQPSEASLDWAREAAARLAQRDDVRTISAAEFAAWERDDTRTLYVFDVRTPEEYAAGHLSGAISAQGGQLVQEIDTYAPVWNSRIVLVDDDALVRARMTASWLLQMGCPEVVVRTLGPSALELGPQPARVVGLQLLGADVERCVGVAQLVEWLRGGRVNVVDLSPSPQYKAGHIPGAFFATRVRLVDRVPQLPPREVLALTSEDGLVARFAAAELTSIGVRVVVLAGGNRAWQAAGQPLAQGFEAIHDVIDDAWLPPPQRDGDVHAAIEEYLAWEVDLPRQVGRDPSVRFQIAKTEKNA